MGCKFKDRCPSYDGWCEGIDYPDERCISYILDDYENEKKKSEDIEWLYHSPYERDSWVDFDAIEKALGFRLFGWQKEYILSGCAYAGRSTGKITAEILHQLLSVDEDPIDFSKPAPSIRIAINRQYYHNIWKKLHDAGIEIRPVFWNKKDKEEYEKIIVPDCNNCVYLNLTEKEQQLYGLNHYKENHRCMYYETPVYHRSNSTKHDYYIYPCKECSEANFVNYFDCKKGKKGE